MTLLNNFIGSLKTCFGMAWNFYFWHCILFYRQFYSRYVWQYLVDSMLYFMSPFLISLTTCRKFALLNLPQYVSPASQEKWKHSGLQKIIFTNLQKYIFRQKSCLIFVSIWCSFLKTHFQTRISKFRVYLHHK